MEPQRCRVPARRSIRNSCRRGANEVLPTRLWHRIVHGGERHLEAVRAKDDALSRLRDLADLPPLHQAKSLAAWKR